MPRHFLDLHQVDPGDLREIIADSAARKAARLGLGKALTDKDAPLSGKLLAMIFGKPSTRTRVSFDVAMRQLGGETMLLSESDMQLGRGETIADTARVLSRYVDAIMIRTNAHDVLLELAEHATVPVINGLTDDSHPCQLMADVLTFEEHRGPIKGRKVAWSGDGNNVATSWIHAAQRFGFALDLACPEALMPDAETVAWAKDQGAKVRVVSDPYEAVADADCVVTDTWVSTKPDAIFMHDLPAHRGDEATASVMDGPQSVIFDEAENRLHAQKGVLRWCFA